MKIGQYVRCPFIIEDKDLNYPRSFVLGQVTEINELSGIAAVRLHDLKNSLHYFREEPGDLPCIMERLDRCRAAVDAPVNTPDGAGVILSHRTASSEDDFYEYYVMLHNGTIRTYPEQVLGIEYTCMEYSPVRQMLHYEFQNPSWYANRLPVSENMHMVNNTVYGFKELAGCRTFLMAHQISTIVRMFEARPIRYMLADEVGLGKTIEACSVVKILNSEKRDLRVLYLVPRSLAQQWSNELKYKFSISAVHNTGYAADGCHVIVSLEELQAAGALLREEWDLLIVDETHRLLPDEAAYNTVLSLSQRVRNVLLLSATPIQSREEEYLRLLTLLQPDRYRLLPQDRFASLLSKQKKIQRQVNRLISHMKRYEDYREDSLEHLQKLADELQDDALSSVVAQIDLASDDLGRAGMEQAVSYISENYRIEHSLIRNRRDFVREVLGERVLQAVPYRMKNAQQNYCEQNVYLALLACLSPAIAAQTVTVGDALRLLQAMFSSPWALEAAVLSLRIEDPDLLSLIQLWRMQAEDEMKQVDVLLDETPEEISGRLLYALDFIEQEVSVSKDNNGKVVVFSEFPETLRRFSELLSHRDIPCVSFTAAMPPQELEDSVYAFQNDPSCRIILCDATGGEGRNFQNADWLIHLDLPWTANAIEQRIGRLDRLGRDRDHLTVTSVVLCSEHTIEAQLFEIWNKGLALFERSLSGLEIITRELNDRIAEALSEDIYNGLENALDDIMDLTDSARSAVEDEQLYDAGSMIYRPLSVMVSQMLETYSSGENDLFRSSMLGWADQVGLTATASKDETIRFLLGESNGKSAKQAFFVPPDWEQYQNTAIVRRAGQILGTFDRSAAIKREDLLFYAPGDPVFDSIIRNAMNSGRGRCCALAGAAPFRFSGFICIYNVEPRIEELLERGIPVQLLSQFRMYLPMKQILVPLPYAGSDAVSEKELTAYLSNKRNLLNADHLGRRPKVRDGDSPLVRFMLRHPEEEWENTVRSAEKRALKIAGEKARELSDLETARHEIDRIVSGYVSECLYLNRDPAEITAVRERYDAVFDALSHPVLTLDSMGLLLLRPGQ